MTVKLSRQLDPPVDPEVLGQAFQVSLQPSPLGRTDTVEEHMTWWEDEYRKVLQTAKYRGDHEEAVRSMWSIWMHPGPLFAEVETTLRGLADAGYPLGVISNWAPPLEEALTSLGIRHLFEVVICSTLVGVRKPARTIFEVAGDAFDVPASRCIYIGDSVELDVEGALGAGMRAILIERDGQDRQQRCSLGSYRTISSLEALLP